VVIGGLISATLLTLLVLPTLYLLVERRTLHAADSAAADLTVRPAEG
jgi:Cu/Ag efflux pump CusA